VKGKKYRNIDRTILNKSFVGTPDSANGLRVGNERS